MIIVKNLINFWELLIAIAKTKIIIKTANYKEYIKDT